LLTALVATTLGCTSSDASLPLSESDYDDVAQALSSVVTTSDRGGEVGLLYDSTQLAGGVPSLGFVAAAAGRFDGKRGNLAYAYELRCEDVAGDAMPQCDLTSDAASVSVTCTGALSTPHLDADLDHQAELRLLGIQSGVVEIQGDGNFALDAHFSSAWRNVELDYQLDYTVSYDDLRIRRVPLQILSGSVRYAIEATRMTLSDDMRSMASFRVDGELVFGADGFATLTLDGTHEYRIHTTSGVVVKSAARR
jgi:hypothetical protein